MPDSRPRMAEDDARPRPATHRRRRAAVGRGAAVAAQLDRRCVVEQAGVEVHRAVLAVRLPPDVRPAAAQGERGAAQGNRAAARRNVVFILSDDHRYDFMSFSP